MRGNYLWRQSPQSLDFILVGPLVLWLQLYLNPRPVFLDRYHNAAVARYGSSHVPLVIKMSVSKAVGKPLRIPGSSHSFTYLECKQMQPESC